jgi:hypothetical protein
MWSKELNEKREKRLKELKVALLNVSPLPHDICAFIAKDVVASEESTWGYIRAISDSLKKVLTKIWFYQHDEHVRSSVARCEVAHNVLYTKYIKDCEPFGDLSYCKNYWNKASWIRVYVESLLFSNDTLLYDDDENVLIFLSAKEPAVN